jgi:nucleoside 2-deoxyribosyltransferase
MNQKDPQKMNQSHTSSVLSMIAGRLARAMDPTRASVRHHKSTPCKKIYFADNMRYSPGADADKWREIVSSACLRHGLDAQWPSAHFLFPNIKMLGRVRGKWEPRRVSEALAISPLVNVSSSIAIVAEVTPFRGPHLNPEIAFEMGIAATLGLPIFGWTTATYPAYPGAKTGMRPQLLQDRVWCGDAADEDGHWYDERFNCDLVENFDLVENAAIAGNLATLSVSVEQAIASCAEYLRGAGKASPVTRG